MCCFSPPLLPASLLRRLFDRPLRVSATRIYARRDGDQQLLAYAMNLRTPAEVAMILPLPVPPGASERDLQFIDLSGAPDLFELLAAAFVAPARKGGLRLPALPRLAVHQVGAFEASFAPSVADLDRLDPRFRLPDAVWSSLPVHDFGFAVFKLRQARRAAAVHPMALRFTSRDPARLFFPTLHVHDGHAHATAEFDHTLYYQRDDATTDPEHASAYAPPAAAERTRGLVRADRPLSCVTLQGLRPNADTWLTA